MTQIAIGTTSRYKVNAILKSLYELDFEFTAQEVNVDSEVSEQPQAEGEVKQGSINRARNALSKVSDADIGIGVEFGYEPVGEDLHMVCWATIATRDGKLYSEHSFSLQLPTKLQEVLKSGKDVSSNLNLVFELLDDIEHHRIFTQYLKKRRFIYESVRAVGIRYLLEGVTY